MLTKPSGQAVSAGLVVLVCGTLIIVLGLAILEWFALSRAARSYSVSLVFEIATFGRVAWIQLTTTAPVVAMTAIAIWLFACRTGCSQSICLACGAAAAVLSGICLVVYANSEQAGILTIGLTGYFIVGLMISALVGAGIWQGLNSANELAFKRIVIWAGTLSLALLLLSSTIVRGTPLAGPDRFWLTEYEAPKLDSVELQTTMPWTTCRSQRGHDWINGQISQEQYCGNLDTIPLPRMQDDVLEKLGWGSIRDMQPHILGSTDQVLDPVYRELGTLRNRYEAISKPGHLLTL